jgi:hypothetical protein
MIYKVNFYKLLMLLVLFSTTFTFSYGQNNATAIPDQVKKLDKFVGSWKGDLVYSHDNAQDRMTSTMTFKTVSGGFGVYADETSASPTLGTMKGADLMGYDPYTKEIHCFTVDNMGTTHDHICQWKSDNEFYLEHSSTRDGKKYQEKIYCTFKGTNEIVYKADIYLDGKLTESTTGNYTRVP